MNVSGRAFPLSSRSARCHTREIFFVTFHHRRPSIIGNLPGGSLWTPTLGPQPPHILVISDPHRECAEGYRMMPIPHYYNEEATTNMSLLCRYFGMIVS